MISAPTPEEGMILLEQLPRTAAARRKRSAYLGYYLEEQIGFILRQATQRHVGIYSARMGDTLTPMQFAATSMLSRTGPCSQNQLGRLIAMDAATIKGVIDRLTKRGLTRTAPDPGDARLLIVTLTAAGAALNRRAVRAAMLISEETLAPLTATERKQLTTLLKKLG